VLLIIICLMYFLSFSNKETKDNTSFCLATYTQETWESIINSEFSVQTHLYFTNLPNTDCPSCQYNRFFHLV
jgi:hypothetical protein